MSLVVAGIAPSGQIVAVADTKITWPDDARTRHIWEEARPKLLILRPDLLVGITGDDYERIARELVAHRADTLDSFLASAAEVEGADLVVAATDPSRLWHVSEGTLTDRTPYRRAWAGDHEAYESFRGIEGSEPDASSFGLS